MWRDELATEGLADDADGRATLVFLRLAGVLPHEEDLGAGRIVVGDEAEAVAVERAALTRRRLQEHQPSRSRGVAKPSWSARASSRVSSYMLSACAQPSTNTMDGPLPG